MKEMEKFWKERKKNAGYAKWLMSYTKPYLGRIILVMSLGILATVIQLLLALVSKKVIDNATSNNPIVVFIVVYIVLLLTTQVVNVISTLVSTMLVERFSFGIRRQIYEKIINSYWMNVKKYHTGDLMTRLTSDAGNVADGIIGTLPSIITLAIELILVFVTLFYYSPLLAVLALTVAPVAAIVAWALGKKMKRLQIKVQESEAAYRSFMQESLANLLIVKSFANEDYFSNRFARLREERFTWVFKKTKLSLASSTVMGVTFQLGYIAAFAYGAIQVSMNIITYGTMSIFLTLVNRVQGPIIELSQKIPRIVSIFASAGRIIELQNMPLEEKKPLQIEKKNISMDIANLTFGYDSENVLENISLNLASGEFVGIVGESGIGKTTLIRLVMAFMENYEGSITFKDEHGNISVNNPAIREYISYVPQGNTLFSGTIRENIRMGNINATEEEMIEAMKLASAYDFVMELPRGIDTVIGERGHGISEGQAQRIAIARAFVRKSPFLILDEATSSLDEETEKNVIKGLQQLNPKPTCIIITHRRSILEYCDREIKLKDKHAVMA